MSGIHNQVIDILFNICSNYKTDKGKEKYSEIYADHISEAYQSLIFTTRTRKNPPSEHYRPDIWAKTRSKIDIFEVWHTESKTEAIEDLLFSSFIPEIRWLHIVCTGSNLKDKDAEKLVKLILHKVRNENGEHRLHPNNVFITQIPKKIQSDLVAMEKHLIEELDFG